MPANMVIYYFFLQICLEESSLCDSLSPIVFAHNDANTPNMVMTINGYHSDGDDDRHDHDHAYQHGDNGDLEDF